MILTLAGRRIDAVETKQPRFPAQNVASVKEKIRSLLAREKPQALVCSAANGADLLALELAEELGIERHIVLPFPTDIFRTSSVIDRAGSWAEMFDRIVGNLKPEEEVISLDYPVKTTAAYVATNRAILERAQLLASGNQQTLMAAIVWNGVPRGEQDLTADFKAAAEKAGIPIREVFTI